MTVGWGTWQPGGSLSSVYRSPNYPRGYLCTFQLVLTHTVSRYVSKQVQLLRDALLLNCTCRTLHRIPPINDECCTFCKQVETVQHVFVNY